MKKRAASLFLSLALCMGLTVTASAAFSDVKGTDYFSAPVAWAVENDITAGTSATTFSPGQLCTRGQIITFIWRAAGSPEPKAAANPFDDVTAKDYFDKATRWAAEQSMASGSKFAPNDPCTRAMAVEFMWKLDGAPEMEPAAEFTDVKAGDSFAQAVSWAKEKGVTAGTSATTFSPDQTCTRGQIMTFLFKGFGEPVQPDTDPSNTYTTSVPVSKGYYKSGAEIPNDAGTMTITAEVRSAYELLITMKTDLDWGPTADFPNGEMLASVFAHGNNCDFGISINSFNLKNGTYSVSGSIGRYDQYGDYAYEQAFNFSQQSINVAEKTISLHVTLPQGTQVTFDDMDWNTLDGSMTGRVYHSSMM